MMKALLTKHTNYRARRFQVVTQVLEEGGRRFVRKQALYPEGLPHIEAIGAAARALENVQDDIAVCPCEVHGDTATFEYIGGESLTERITQHVQSGDRAALKEVLGQYREILLVHGENTVPMEQGAEFAEVFGDIVLPAGLDALALCNLDATPDNIIYRDGKPVLIDYEWVFTFPIPRDFVLYRNLSVFHNLGGSGLEKMMDMAGLGGLFGITMDMDLLRRMDERLGQYIEGVGTGYVPPARLFGSYLKAEHNVLDYAEKDAVIASLRNEIQQRDATIGALWKTKAKSTLRKAAASVRSSLRGSGDGREAVVDCTGGGSKDFLWRSAEGTRADKLFCSIDECGLSGETLTVRGWIYTAYHRISGLALCVRNGEGSAQTQIWYGSPRRDVMEVTGDIRALRTGFAASMRLQASGEVDIGLELQCGAWQARAKVGTVAAHGRPGGVELSGYDIARQEPYGPYILENGALDSPALRPVAPQLTDVILILENGGNARRLIEEMKRTEAGYRLTVVTDGCTVEPECLEDPLREVVVIHHEQKRGLGASLDEALRQAHFNAAVVHEGAHLPVGWLERLMRPLWEDESIATATPFSNAGGIMGYRAQDIGASMIDRQLARVLPEFSPLPCGGGICVAIGKKALRQAGLPGSDLSAWSIKAAQTGHRNVAIENLYVTNRTEIGEISPDDGRFDYLKAILAIGMAARGTDGAEVIFGGGERDPAQAADSVAVAVSRDAESYTAACRCGGEQYVFRMKRLHSLNNLLLRTGVASVGVASGNADPVVQKYAEELRLRFGLRGQ